MSEKEHEIIEDTIYQIQTQNGPTRRYVRAVKIYGDKDLVDCEVVRCKDKKMIGKTIRCDASVLAVPDQYPRFQFNPGMWKQKVEQSAEAKQAEISDFIDNQFRVRSITASDVVSQEAAKKTISTLKDVLLPYFGGFTLALFINFVKNKINSVIENRAGNKPEPKSFGQKVSEMNRVWSKKAAQESAHNAKSIFNKHKDESK